MKRRESRHTQKSVCFDANQHLCIFKAHIFTSVVKVSTHYNKDTDFKMHNGIAKLGQMCGF